MQARMAVTVVPEPRGEGSSGCRERSAERSHMRSVKTPLPEWSGGPSGTGFPLPSCTKEQREGRGSPPCFVLEQEGQLLFGWPLMPPCAWQDIILTVKEKLSIRSMEYFALALEEQYNISRLHLLHEEELIQQVQPAAVGRSPGLGKLHASAKTSAGGLSTPACLMHVFVPRRHRAHSA